jgi:putative membrane protein
MWGYGHDWGMTGGWGGGAFSMIIWPLVIFGLVVGRRSSGLDILGERYARGEINREEFLQKKQELSG